MALNKKIVWGIFVLAFLVMSVVSVCGQNDFGSPDISASPNIVNYGDEITVTYSGAPGFDLDWIAIYEVGDPNEWYGDWYYLNGEQSGTLLFTAPEGPGDYEFRLFENDGFTDIAWSNVVSVQVGTTETPTPTQPAPSTPSMGLVAYYPFEDNADDKSGNGNHGTNNGATFVAGISGHALKFDGKDDYVSAPVNINPEVMSQMTMTAWALSDKASGVVISVDNGGYDRQLSIDNRGGGTGWSAFSGSGGVLGYSPVTIGEWVFLAVVYDQNAETVKLYVNNQMYEEKGSLGSGWKDIFIGKSPSFGAHFSGTIDEVRIYNYALTQSEINSLYAGGTPPPGAIPPPEFSGLIFESRSKSSGSTVQIPLTLTGATDKIGNMDITLGYDPSVLEATEVIKGGLTTNSLFEYNLIDRGTIKISLADEAGFSGDGSIAYIRFNVIGYEGSGSPLEIVSISANRAKDMAPLSITTQDGVFTVLGFEEGKGDCTGDGKITAADALCALVMAVGKIPEDLVMDANGDGKVTSLDAREILQMAVEKEEPPSTGSSSTQIDAFKESARKCEPAEMTLVIDDNMEIFYRIEGERDGYCVLYEKVVKDNTGYGFAGKDMTCNIPIDKVREDTPLPEDFNIKEYCNGTLADEIVKMNKRVNGVE